MNCAVVGLGRAGKARMRDLPLVGALLGATVSRRPGVGSHTFAQVLGDSSIGACLITTENATHAELAEACLHAGKHVLVEFPLAHDVATAGHLYDLARDRQLVLHCELIGLLTAEHARFRQMLTEQPVARVQLGFTGGCEGWLAQEARNGHWGQLSVARLHALWDALGPLTLRHATVETSTDGYRLVVDLLAATVEVRLIELRLPGLARGRTFEAFQADGTAVDPQSPRGDLPDREDRGEGLFLRDLKAFLRRIESGNQHGAYVSDADVLAVMALAEAISARVSG